MESLGIQQYIQKEQKGILMKRRNRNDQKENRKPGHVSVQRPKNKIPCILDQRPLKLTQAPFFGLTFITCKFRFAFVDY